MVKRFADGAISLYDPDEIPVDELFGYEKKIQAGIGLGLFVAKQKMTRRTLVVGYPGTGKTIFPSVVARQLNADDYGQNFSLLTVDCDKIAMTKKYENDLKRATAAIQNQAPAVIAYDEFEGVAPSIQQVQHGSVADDYSRMIRSGLSPDRTRLVKLLIFCVSNYPRKIDDSTATRFDSVIYFHAIDEDAIGKIIEHHLKLKNFKDVASSLVKKRRDIGFATLGFNVDDACKGLCALPDFMKDMSKNKSAEDVADLLYSLCGPSVEVEKVAAYEDTHKPWRELAERQEKLWAELATHSKKVADITK